MIPYGTQSIDQSDIQAVVDVLQSPFLTQGPAVELFEAKVKRFCGAKHAAAVNSATSALHIACLALGVGPGDIVWTSPNTFVASANCALYCGADIDFVDIDDRTYNMCVNALQSKLAEAERNGLLPKVVIPVHLSGQPCDMKAIRQLADRYGFKIIEDASHAIGATYSGEPVGNCRYSDITVFSFHPVKIITTAEGGMALTNNDSLASRLCLFRSHGITRDPGAMTKPADGPWYYQQLELGFNYRMTDIQAALGVSQMARLQTFIDRRRALAKRYDELLKHLPLTLPWQHPDGHSAFHLYVIRLKLGELRVSHRNVFEGLRHKGIGVNLHYIPVHLQPYYQAKGFKAGDFPIAEQYYADAISIPMFATLTDEMQNQVVSALESSLRT